MIESSESTTLSSTVPYQSISYSLRIALVAAVRSPATWLFVCIWLAALTYLLVTGYTESLPLILEGDTVMLLVVLLAIPLTRNASPITTE